MKKVIRYVCDHCKYTRAKKKTVEKHEEMCFKNPASKSCATCANLEVPALVSENGILKINEAHYRQMLLPQYKEHLETHEYPDGVYADFLGVHKTDVTTTEVYHHNYCHAKGCIDKLTTKCPFWELKEK